MASAPKTRLGGLALIRLPHVPRRRLAAAVALAAVAIPTLGAFAEPAKPAREEDGKYFDAEGNPTYNVKADGTVDWYTYSGYRRYHA